MVNKLKIVGNIDKNTPHCVIKEIFNSYLLDVDINRLHEDKYFKSLLKTIPDEIEETIENIAYFVNPHIEWRESVLLEAYEHLMKFYEDGYDLPDSLYFSYGLKNMNNLYSYDACMLYKICKINNIHTNSTNTIEDLYYAVLSILNPIETRKAILNTLNTLSLSSLIGLSLTNIYKDDLKIEKMDILQVSYPESLRNINYENLKDLKATISNLYNTSNLLSRIQPTSQEEAIIMGAVVYHINLTECINPYEEYKHINKFRERYIPIDNIFREKYLKCKEWYNTKLTWCEKLTYMYPTNKLTAFIKEEGYSDIINPIEKLKEIRNSNTFYDGIHPYTSNIITPIELEDIFSLDKELLISFGNVTTKEIFVYSIDEITRCFQMFKCFMLNNIIFDKNVLNKLKNIINKKEKEKIKKLLESIDIVILYETYKDNALINLINLFNSKDKHLKKQFLTLIKSVLEMGMFMRKWDGYSKYPLTQGECAITDENDPLVNKRSYDAIKRFDNLYNEFIEIHYIFDHLKLFKIDKTKTSLEFIKSTTLAGGFTILDRINIVKDYDFDNPNSCIRCSSNWFCGSAYYYLILIGEPTPFDYKLFYDLPS